MKKGRQNMARDIMTDESFKEELERLKGSENVKLAQKEIRLKNRQKNYLYQLRWLEKRGKQLAALGYTIDNMEEMIAQAEAQVYALEEED